MHRFLAASSLFAVLLVASAASGQVRFSDEPFDAALRQASERGALVLVDVYATWCGPCHRLDEEVFPTPLVGEAASNMVAIKVDAEAGEGPALVERYHVVGYPTVLVLRADGTEIDRVFGYHPPEDFAELLRGFEDGTATLDALRERVAADPDNLEQRMELAERTLVRGDVAEGEAMLRALMDLDASNERGLRSRAHLFLGKYGYLRSRRDFAAAVAEFDVILREFPGSPQALSAQLQAGIALLRAGDVDAAFARFDAAIATSPEEPALYNAVAFSAARERAGLEQAAARARAGLTLAPEDASLWDTYAEVLAASGDLEGALEAIGEAIEHAPDEAYYRTQQRRFEAERAAAASESSP